MRLIDYLDKGASLGRDAPCFTTGEANLSYAEVQQLTYRVARSAADGGDQTRRESRCALGQRSCRLRLRFRAVARGKPSGVRSIRGTRLPRTAMCLTLSTAAR